MKKIILIFYFAVSATLFSQQTKIDELNTIYYNLEYNTIAYDDMKEKWIITDPLLVRDTFNRFLVKNKLSKFQTKLSRSQLLQISGNLDEMEVVILLSRRYYDNEIESMIFIPFDDLKDKSLNNPIVDPIEGWFFIRDVVGTGMYEKLKEQSYFYNDLSQKKFYEREGYYFDVYLNAIKPRLMVWSNTTDATDKYLFSFEGEWGQSKIYNSGWFSNMYFVGGSVKYFGAVSNNPDEYSYKISLMADVETKFPYPHHANRMLKYYNHLALSLDTRISTSRYSFFSKTYFSSYVSAAISTEPGRRINNYNNPNEALYAIEHTAAFEIEQKDIIPFGDFGKLGVGLAFNAYNIDKRFAGKNNSGSFGWAMGSLQKEAGVSLTLREFGKLLSFNLKAQFLYDFNEKSVYGGATLDIMLSNTFGLYIQYLRYLKWPENFPWRQSSMIVFSPILRINY